MGKRIIGNDRADQPIGPVQGAASTPTPLRGPAPLPARATPRGGVPRPISLPLCVTPYGHSGLPGPARARLGVGANGVGGSGLSLPGRTRRESLALGVRT
jgi:hypothetical protein